MSSLKSTCKRCRKLMRICDGEWDFTKGNSPLKCKTYIPRYVSDPLYRDLLTLKEICDGGDNKTN